MSDPTATSEIARPRRFLLWIGAALAVVVAVAIGVAVGGSPRAPSGTRLPLPSSLSDVSCASPVKCMAIGAGVVDQHFYTDVAQLTSASIGSVTTSSPLPAYESVSCLHSGWCMVLGYSSTRDKRRDQVAAETVTGRSWRRIAGPVIGQVTSYSLSCGSPHSCVVVSGFGTGPRQPGAAAAWNGSSWTAIHRVPDVQYQGVSCVGDVWCMLVGQRANTGYEVPLTAVWNGSSLRTVALPGDSDLDTFIDGVSCGSPSSCLAIGWVQGGPNVPSGNLGGVIYRWNGTHWSLMSAPLAPHDATWVSLQSVSCSDARHCVVVGVVMLPRGERLAAYELIGASWKAILPATNPAWNLEGQGGLVAVSCFGPKSCVAVGPIQIHRLDAALVERWHGRQWVPAVGPVRQRPLVIPHRLGA